MECIFCKIINNEIPSKKVYENDDVLAFLDVNPLAKGHVLVVPKNHYVDLTDIPSDELIKIMDAIKYLYPKMEEILGCTGFHFVKNYGSCQEVKHAHFHIIPKYQSEKPLINNYPSEQIDIEATYEALKGI